MFIHLFFGALVFLVLGHFFGFEINAGFLLLGALTGIAPDILGFFGNARFFTRFIKGKTNKHFHEHRDGLVHSLFFPLFVLTLFGLLGELKLGGLIMSALLTHPLLDLYGIGWGVKLFYPFSQVSYKLFYKDKFLYAISPQELKKSVGEGVRDDWMRQIYFQFSWYGLLEWLLLAALLGLVFWFGI